LLNIAYLALFMYMVGWDSVFTKISQKFMISRIQYVQFTQQQMHFFILKHIKIYIKIHINIAPTFFGLRPSSGNLHWTWLKLYLC